MKQLCPFIRPVSLALFWLFAFSACQRVEDLPVEELNAKYGITEKDYVEVDGINVHFRREGNRNDSVPLVLLHGTGSSLYTYDSWAKSLSDQRQVIRLDLPAFGLTGPHPDQTYTLDFYVGFLHAFLEKMNVKRCVLAGNSLGGEITWQYALKYPQQVQKMILIGAAGYPTKSRNVPLPLIVLRLPAVREVFKKSTPREVVRESLNYLYADTTLVTDSLVTLYYDLTRREGNREALTDRMESIGQEGPWKQIPTIQTPTLLLWGEADQLIPIQYGERFEKDLPNAKLVRIPNAGHMPMEEAPDVSVEAVRAFLGIEKR